MQVIRYPSKNDWPEILKRPVLNTHSLEQRVKSILSDVQKNGDQAVHKYTREFDRADLHNIKVTERERTEAEAQLSEELKQAIRQAAANIENFHKAQVSPISEIETMPGVVCWRKSVAIEKVGLYIPGGSAPLFSTVLMLGIPARLAGCREIILCSPPSNKGLLHPAILFAACLTGITQVFKVGGVQAIGAMAFGTESIPKVNKIFGPGNQYVTCAKQFILQQGIAIDMPAGPSEVAVLADESSNPAYIAADLLSQAEHGKDSQVLLITLQEKIIESVQREITTQLEKLPRKRIAEQALENSKMILLQNPDEAIELINSYAPEHLILSCKEEETVANRIMNAGSVFLGNFSPESVGDYASGTNHTLPTNGFAKAYSGVSLDSFVKKITFQKLSKEGLQNIAPVVEQMAEAESLQGHKNAISIRKS